VDGYQAKGKKHQQTLCPEKAFGLAFCGLFVGLSGAAFPFDEM